MIEYQEFLCYALENDGTHKEMEIEEKLIEEQLNPDDVLIFVKQDLRRLFIWKGPKAPVRKRFISSRVAAKIQEEIRQESGRHVKIVSVDAGDEPIEFLSTFNLESMEITEKMNDMVYVRNIERDRMKEEQIKKTIQQSKSEDEYWSPLLDEANNSSPVQSGVRTSLAAPKRQVPTSSYSPKPASKTEVSVEQDLDVIKEVLQNDPPKGLHRVNIIIGRRLYAPGKKTSEVFGEMVETETWDIVPNLPKDIINFSTRQIRVYTERTTGEIKAIEVYKKNPSPKKSTKKSSKKKSTKSKPKKENETKRDLPKIPTAEE